MFLPKIADNVSKETIKETFQKLLIGSVSEIDMYRKKSKHTSFWYAFIAVDLYKTTCAQAISRKLKEKGFVKIVYDEPKYWEIRTYVPVHERISKKDDIKELCDSLTKKSFPEYNWLLPENYTGIICSNSLASPEEKEIIMEDYDKLEKEIYGCARIYY